MSGVSSYSCLSRFLAHAGRVNKIWKCLTFFLVCFFMFTLFVISAGRAEAAPAFPGLVELRQPDGSVFLARQWGDEWLHGWETADGYTICKEDATGYWYYARTDETGNLVSTDVRADRTPPADIPKYVRPLIETRFKDSAAIPAWARGVVVAAAKEGLVRGYPQPDGTVTFEPDRSVSRVEMAALVVRILEKKIGTVVPAELKFTDAGAIPDWARTSVGVAAAKGIAVGYPDNTFRPDKPVTRAEAAAMIFRLLDSVGNK